jgi:hypothetical protein
MAMPLQLVPSQSDPDTWLHDYDDQFLACRMGHDWPQLVPGRKRQARTTIQRLKDEPDQVQGVYLVTQHCSRCQRTRWRLTGAHGLVEHSQWKYHDPKHYAQPPGLGLTRSDFSREYWRRIMEEHVTAEQGEPDPPRRSRQPRVPRGTPPE